MLPTTYTVAEAAAELKLDRKTIERLIRYHHLRAVDLTPWSKNRKWIITEETITAFLRGEKPPPKPEIETRKSVARRQNISKNPFPTLAEINLDGK